MDRKSVKEEGILESYLLGILKKQEEEALLKLLSEDQELRRELKDLETEFELLGFENAMTPPESVREELIRRLSLDSGQTRQDSFLKTSGTKGLNSGKLLIAASLAAFFAIGSFWLYLQWKSSVDEVDLLQRQTLVLQEQLHILEQRYETTQTRYSSISKPGIIPLYLVGNELAPQSSLIAYIDHNEKTVVVNSKGLTPLDTDKTYQMWADVEGEMINMGVLPAAEDYIPMRYIDKAESLNITVEPAGGSEHPTVENLISNIYL